MQGVGVVVVGVPQPLLARRARICSTFVSSDDVSLLDAYLKRTVNPTGRILKTEATYRHKPAPVVAAFSSRGPSVAIPRICKPDIAAPGQDILAAVTPLAGLGNYVIYHGTSMACPHVTSIVALLKAVHPLWSPAALKSAVMTSARQVDDTFTNSSLLRTYPSMQAGGPFDFGSGIVHLSGALDPGLIYDTNYDVFAAQVAGSVGHTGNSHDEPLQAVSSGPNSSFARASDIDTGMDAQQLQVQLQRSTSLSDEQISNLNYPSITVGGLRVGTPVRIVRTVTNVGGSGASTYTGSVTFWPPGDATVSVTLDPSVLQFRTVGQQLSFTVIFNLEGRRIGASPLSGLLTWSDGLHTVASPLVVL